MGAATGLAQPLRRTLRTVALARRRPAPLAGGVAHRLGGCGPPVRGLLTRVRVGSTPPAGSGLRNGRLGTGRHSGHRGGVAAERNHRRLFLGGAPTTRRESGGRDRPCRASTGRHARPGRDGTAGMLPLLDPGAVDSRRLRCAGGRLLRDGTTPDRGNRGCGAAGRRRRGRTDRPSAGRGLSAAYGRSGRGSERARRPGCLPRDAGDRNGTRRTAHRPGLPRRTGLRAVGRQSPGRVVRRIRRTGRLPSGVRRTGHAHRRRGRLDRILPRTGGRARRRRWGRLALGLALGLALRRAPGRDRR
ncbi:hypothetical protein [Micromonospora sp. RTGN7]|uniref:hypothetical protein n=1 Tax=Micromonospora sp. RTGN7 TaxID=3016526 RepID=UPI0029FEDED1|nr:hypothetical protein [Micromonospora sp. RTGN7]